METTVKFTDLPHAELMEIKLSSNQAKFYHEKELDGVKFKELVDAEFLAEVKKMIDVLPSETLCLMGDWDVRMFRGVLRKYRAEYDTNELTLEDVDLAELNKLAKKIDFAKAEEAMANLPEQIKALAEAYREVREVLASAYSKLTGRELNAIGFARATSLYKLREEVVQHLDSQ